MKKMIRKTTPQEFVDEIFKMTPLQREFVIKLIENTVKDMELLKNDKNREQYTINFDENFKRDKEILKIYRRRKDE
jgi:hypothetical protein